MTPILTAALIAGPAFAVDPAAWKGTRWVIGVEEVLPREVLWQAVTNEEFIIKAAQARVVLACDQAEPEGKRTVVTCRVEEAAIQAIPHGYEPSERELENSLIVIEEMVTRLESAPIEFVLDKHGAVVRADALLPEARNDRERTSNERIRQLATDLVTGFSLRQPKAWTGTWAEYNPKLARVPATPAAGGSSSFTHSAAETDGRVVIQSVGSGYVEAYYVPWELESAGRVAGTRRSDTAVEGATMQSGGSTTGVSRINEGTAAGGASAVGSTPETVKYDISLRSVAVVNDDRLTERVWSVAGAGTASSISSFEGVNLWYSGQLRQLEPNETPDLGATRLVAPPGVTIGDLPPWDPMGD